MKNLLIILSMLLVSITARATEEILFYPVKYHNDQDVLIKIPKLNPELKAELLGENLMLELVDDVILLQNRPFKESYTLQISTKSNDSIVFTYKYSGVESDVLDLDFPLYRALTQWSVQKNQEEKLSDYLVQVTDNNLIYIQEVLFFLQQYFDEQIYFSRDLNYLDNIKTAFSSYKSANSEGCQCIQLNHSAQMAPLKPNAGAYQDGYNYYANGQFSQGINHLTEFESYVSKWHRWYSNEKGPAHDLFLRQYDSGGSFKYEWSTFGHDNTGGYTPSPNNATLLFNFFCTELGQELPDQCNCTKKISVLYRYDAQFNVIARRLKALSKVHSVAQEIATLTYSSHSGQTEILDAGMAVYQTKCNGSFNFDFIRNWFELGEAVLGLVIDVQDTVNGSIPQDIASNLGAIVDAIEDIVTTSPVRVSGDCATKTGNAALMAGGKVIYLKANDPILVNLSSHSFLGTYGKKKWDNYASIKSNFWLQGVVESGSVEGLDHCCSDKSTRFLQASMNGPQSESDLVKWIESWVKLFAPWDNYNPTGDIPAISPRYNRGYFTYDDPERDCFPTSPKPLDFETHKSFQSFDNKPNENIQESENSKDHLSHIISHTVKVYPNPTNDFLNFELNISGLSEISIEIYNSTGQKVMDVFSGKIEQEQFSVQWKDDEQLLHSGIYFAVVRSGNEIIDTKAIQISK